MKAIPRSLAFTAVALALALGTVPAHSENNAECEVPPVSIRIEADEVVFVDGSGLVEFEGNVEAVHEGRTLFADRVVWNQDNGRVDIPGAFTVHFPSGNVLSGDSGTFNDQLNAGTIFGIDASIRGGPARVRAEVGENTQSGELRLTRASFSPCPISEDDPAPAWRIRASSVRHDTEARELVYSTPVLEIAGVPVFVLPYMRQPDSSVERRSGFLSPAIRTNTAYGFGLRVPYHLAIAPDRNATLTAFTTSKEGFILEGSYRQLFANGDLSAEASFGHRSVLHPEVRIPRRSHGHFFLDLDQETAGLYRYGVEVNLASEKGYLRRYGYSEDDRLRNRVFLERFADDFQLEAESVAFQTQRDDESSRALKYTLPEVRYHRSLREPAFGGRLRVGGDIRYLNCRDCRRSQSMGLEAEWRRHHTFPIGVLTAMHARLRGDMYAFGNQAAESDSGGPYETTARAQPQAGAQLSLPLLRTNDAGAHFLEPVGQIILAPRRSMGDEIPNEDSLDVEFDEHSLFASNRFSGRDSIETGTRGAYGIRYRHLSRAGLALGGVVGRVVRMHPETVFPPQSGLRDRHSDIVGAWSLRLQEPIALRMNHRVRLSPSLSMRRNDFTLRGEAGRLDFSGTYLYVDADTDRAASPERMARGEIQTRLGMDFARRWRLDLSHRRDVEHDRTISIGANLLFEHECFDLQFSAERDYVASDNAPAGTSFGLSLRLLTF